MNSAKRTEYFKKNNIFYSMGNNCLIMDRKVPLYAKLISLGNNVRLASGVHFLTHDVTHLMLNKVDSFLTFRGGQKYPEKLGCIEIGDNVFIGTGTYITYNVRIGSNVIIGACSLVNKDIPDNCIAAGIPARVIKTFDEYIEKRKEDEVLIINNLKESISQENAEKIWVKFRKDREIADDRCTI